MLRKVTYKDYYESREKFFKQAPEIVRTQIGERSSWYHIHHHRLIDELGDHCIEILRQKLMCIADAGVITYEWVHGFSDPYPDFNTLHKCRNFEKILTWIDNRVVDIPLWRITRLEGTIDLLEAP